MDLENSERCVKDSLKIEDIGGRSTVNQDPGNGALVLSSVRQQLLDYYWRMVSTNNVQSLIHVCVWIGSLICSLKSQKSYKTYFIRNLFIKK